MLQKSIHHGVMDRPENIVHLRDGREPGARNHNIWLRVPSRARDRSPRSCDSALRPFFDVVSLSKIPPEDLVRLSKLPASVFHLGRRLRGSLSPRADDVWNGSNLTLSAASTSPQGNTICEEIGNNFEQGRF